VRTRRRFRVALPICIPMHNISLRAQSNASMFFATGPSVSAALAQAADPFPSNTTAASCGGFGFPSVSLLASWCFPTPKVPKGFSARPGAT